MIYKPFKDSIKHGNLSLTGIEVGEMPEYQFDPTRVRYYVSYCNTYYPMPAESYISQEKERNHITKVDNVILQGGVTPDDAIEEVKKFYEHLSLSLTPADEAKILKYSKGDREGVLMIFERPY